MSHSLALDDGDFVAATAAEDLAPFDGIRRVDRLDLIAWANSLVPTRERTERPASTGTDLVESNNQVSEAAEESRVDAMLRGTIPPPDRAMDRTPDCATDRAFVPAIPLLDQLAGLPGLTVRESSLVYLTVLLRIAGYDQLRRLVFPHQNATEIRKCARALEQRGWLQRWSAPVPLVGRIGHVHPTTRAFDAVAASIKTIAADEPWMKTIQLMLPRSGRRPLTLTTAPKWFQHQREVNHLVTSILSANGARILWASTWDSPFPMQAGGLTMPQPDYVLVESSNAGPQIVFGEHDRGSEPVERFIERKVALYSRLSGACTQTLGVDSLRVDVSVLDTPAQKPMARLRRLVEVTCDYGAAELFRFTLGGWLFAFPAEKIWFRKPPTSDSLRWQHHADLTH